MLHKTLETDYTKIFTECWKTDPSIYTTWHETPGTLEECVKKTVDELIESKEQYDLLRFYKIELDNQLIGFYGTEGRYLTTIFIVPEFRKEYRSQIWNMIKEDLGDNFMTALYTKNIRAIKFMLKNGGMPVKTGNFKNEPVLFITFGKGV